MKVFRLRHLSHFFLAIVHRPNQLANPQLCTELGRFKTMATGSALYSNSSLKAAGAQAYASMEGKIDSCLLNSLQEMGIEFMSPVQRKVLGMPSLTVDWYSISCPGPALPHELEADCPMISLVQAKTGTGKTIAFLLPAMQKIFRSSPKKGQVAVLILSPTRGK